MTYIRSEFFFNNFFFHFSYFLECSWRTNHNNDLKDCLQLKTTFRFLVNVVLWVANRIENPVENGRWMGMEMEKQNSPLRAEPKTFWMAATSFQPASLIVIAFCGQMKKIKRNFASVLANATLWWIVIASHSVVVVAQSLWGLCGCGMWVPDGFSIDRCRTITRSLFDYNIFALDVCCDVIAT